MKRENFAARAGRWSARHRKTAIAAWVAFVALALVLGSVVPRKDVADRDSGTGESGKAGRIVDDAFPEHASETVLVQGRDGQSVRDADVRAAVGQLVRRLDADRAVRDVRSPYAAGNAHQISQDGRSALVTFQIPGDDKRAEDHIDGILATTAAVQRAHPGLRVEEFGDASSDKALSQAFADDFKKSEVLSVPITLAILLLAFGALVAAGLPVLLGLSAVMATIGLVGVLSRLILPVGDEVSSVIMLIGLAVGVDYSLFYLRREREERANGRSEQAALAAAAATSGRAVLVSGITVMVAMAGMFLAGDSTFSSIGLGAIAVVAVALVASISVLPALLSLLGDRVDKGRLPFVGRRRTGESRFWNLLLSRTLARPVLSVVLAGGALVALAVPVLQLHTTLPGVDSLPRKLAVMQTYDRIQAAFPGDQIPATVVVKAPDGTKVTAPEYRRAFARVAQQADTTRGLEHGVDVAVSPDASVAQVDVPIAGDGTDDASNAALGVLRGQVAPQLRSELPGATVAVTGMTAGTADFNSLMKHRIGWIFAFVLAMAFLLLLVTFRSVVVPLVAIALNMLSVAAAYGVLVLVFQHGWFESLLDFQATGSVTSWLPLFLFVVLFGLSMDYHVFLLSRIREGVDRGLSTRDAVATGVKSTASTITSAAIVMVAVFSIFGTLSALEFKQMGVGLAAAIFIDATIVRAILMPAVMTLLGERNWYLPRRLAWLPRISHEGALATAPAGSGRAPTR